MNFPVLFILSSEPASVLLNCPVVPISKLSHLAQHKVGNKAQEDKTVKTILRWYPHDDWRCSLLAVDMGSVLVTRAVAFRHAVASAEHLSFKQKDRLLPEPVYGFVYTTCEKGPQVLH